MSFGHIEQAVVNQMRKDCQLGLALSEILERARTSLGNQGDETLVVLRHFMAAFGLSLKDARLLEACPIFSGQAMSVAEVDSLLLPKMLGFVEKVDL